MNIEHFYQTLRELTDSEKIGKRYFEAYHKEIGFYRFLAIEKHPEYLQFDHPWDNQQLLQVEEHYRSMFASFHDQGLTAKEFMPDGKEIETEQLKRYLIIPPHKHDFVEVVCVLEGRCRHVMDGHTTIHMAGDFTIIPPGIIHELRAEPDCVCLTTKLLTPTFKSLFSDLLLGNSVTAYYFTQELALPCYRCALTLHSGPDAFLRNCILHIYAQQLDDGPYSDIIITSLWRALFAYLLQNYHDTADFLVSDSVQHGQMIQVLNFIFANYQTITLEETARHFSFNKSYLSTKISKLTGKTFTEMLREYKLKKAEELLVQTDMHLSLICDEVGYKDVPQFVRSFKKAYGATPGNYRKAKKF